MLVPLLLLLEPAVTPPVPSVTKHEGVGGGGGKDFWYDITDPKFNIHGKKESPYISRPFHYAQNNPRTEEDIDKKVRRLREKARKVVKETVYVQVAQKQLASLVDRKPAKLLAITAVAVGVAIVFWRK